MDIPNAHICETLYIQKTLLLIKKKTTFKFQFSDPRGQDFNIHPPKVNISRQRIQFLTFCVIARPLVLINEEEIIEIRISD